MFESVLRDATLIVANIHDELIRLGAKYGLALNDKQMHFIVMLAVGMVLFFFVQAVFTRLAEISVTMISFIYVFTVMTVLGFAIEVGQRITGTGSMDFADIVAGLYGVLAFFAVYAAYRLVVWAIGWVWRKATGKR